jgi:hypothetical protein
MAVAKKEIIPTETFETKGSDKINKLNSAEVDKYFDSEEGKKELRAEEMARRKNK